MKPTLSDMAVDRAFNLQPPDPRELRPEELRAAEEFLAEITLLAPPAEPPACALAEILRRIEEAESPAPEVVVLTRITPPARNWRKVIAIAGWPLAACLAILAAWLAWKALRTGSSKPGNAPEEMVKKEGLLPGSHGVEPARNGVNPPTPETPRALSHGVNPPPETKAPDAQPHGTGPKWVGPSGDDPSTRLDAGERLELENLRKLAAARRKIAPGLVRMTVTEMRPTSAARSMLPASVAPGGHSPTPTPNPNTPGANPSEPKPKPQDPPGPAENATPKPPKSFEDKVKDAIETVPPPDNEPETPPGPRVSGVTLFDEATGIGSLLVRDLAPPQTSRDYQAWLTDPRFDHPISIGLLPPLEEGLNKVQFDKGATGYQPNSFFVTEEPAGGSLTPTGQRILVGP